MQPQSIPGIINICYVLYKDEPGFDEKYYDQLLNELIEVISERDNITIQVEEDRIRLDHTSTQCL